MASKSSPALGCNALDSIAFNSDGMRVFKFRAWDKVTSKMSPPFALFGEFTLLGAVHDWQHEMGHTAKTSLEAIGSLEVMQSTGLKDKNGTLIFEGDLISFYDKTVAVIVFESFGGWCFKWIDQTYKNVRQQNPEPIFRNINLFEVAGNIYQNPNLLEL